MTLPKNCKTKGCRYEAAYGKSRCFRCQAAKKREKKRLLKLKHKGRPKPTSLKKLRQELWELCRKIVRLKYGNTCYTCDRKGLEGTNWHTGHFIPASTCGLALKYNIRNLRPQCYHCNINLGGNGAEFYRRMVKEVGQVEVDEMFRIKNQVYTPAGALWYISQIAQYVFTLTKLGNDSP